MSEINNISQLLDGNNPHKQLLEQTRQLVDKWDQLVYWKVLILKLKEVELVF